MRLFVFVFLISLPFVSISQMDSSSYILSIQFGIEKHDKRLFDYSEKELLLAIQPENWGTYNLSLQAFGMLAQSQRISLFAGSGLSYQRATFIRPFDHTFFDQDYNEILRHLNVYDKLLMPVSFVGYLGIGKRLQLDLGYNTLFLLYRRIDNTEGNSNDYPYTAFSFELSRLELVGGINYKLKSFILGVHSRFVNYQKIDNIIFNDIVNDPRMDQKWEFNNPLRIDFSVSFML
jgi:hypothetical protein